MTDHVLCAVDLTHADDAKRIVQKAAELARYNDAAYTVMTVIPDYGASWVGTFFKDGTQRAAAESASEMLHKLVNEALPDHGHVQHVVEIGSVYEKVLEAARETNSDLIVVGAHKPDFADKVVGPNASRIVRHSPVSVMVLRM